MKGYEETLFDLGLKEIRVNLTLNNGNLATNGSGSLLLTNPETDALFNFVNKWRLQRDAIYNLFDIWKLQVNKRSQLERESRSWGIEEIAEKAEHIESIAEAESSVAGAIFVLLSTLLKILDRAGDKKHNVDINGYNVKDIITASANNFRHYDEWAKELKYSNQAKYSVPILCEFLEIEASSERKPITKNICSDSLMGMCHLNFEEIDKIISAIAVDYQNSLS